jgi:signal transduction histidine kinase
MKFNADRKTMDETFYLCEEALKAMTRFVDDISLLNSFNKNNRKAQYEEFVLGELFEETVQQFPEHNRGRVSLVTNRDATRFCTDPFLLSVILKNLIGNALKFSSEQVVLKAEYRNKELTVGIEDSGIGIPQDEIGRVFEPFYRGSNVKLMSGSGLGLAIVKRSMDLLNGAVEVHSLIDHGTTFNIKIRNNGC